MEACVRGIYRFIIVIVRILRLLLSMLIKSGYESYCSLIYGVYCIWVYEHLEIIHETVFTLYFVTFMVGGGLIGRHYFFSFKANEYVKWISYNLEQFLTVIQLVGYLLLLVFRNLLFFKKAYRKR